MSRCLKLEEVQVYGTPSPVDALVSQGKPVYASSEWGTGDMPARNANDGVLSNTFHSSCGNDGTGGPWWGVDLGATVREPAWLCLLRRPFSPIVREWSGRVHGHSAYILDNGTCLPSRRPWSRGSGYTFGTCTKVR